MRSNVFCQTQRSDFLWQSRNQKKVILANLANLPVMVNPILKEAVDTVFAALNENIADLLECVE